MSYLVLARKYRPRNFTEMVGQEHVVQALSNALTQQRLHHAYLFTGTRGVGKTTVSRILAKSLNCQGPDGQGGITATPCGVCQACVDIDSGRFVDYTELDAASNRGVDEVQSLLEQAVYKPVQGRFKVFMIDEVHMLTNTAFNAMLKTLEEPPEYLKFVLATTDPQKVPVTVLSRCLQFNLRPMAPETVLEHLTSVLHSEKVSAEPQALRLLSRAARGSMRDALSLTDQAIAFGSGKLDEATVRVMLGSVDRSYVYRLIDALAKGEGRDVVEISEALRLNGLSAASTLEEMSAVLSRMAVMQAVDVQSDPNDPDETEIARLAEAMPRDETQLLYSMCIHGRAELGLAPDEYAALTMVLLRLMAFKPQSALAEKKTLRQVERPAEKAVSVAAPVKTPPHQPAMAPALETPAPTPTPAPAAPPTVAPPAPAPVSAPVTNLVAMQVRVQPEPGPRTQANPLAASTGGVLTAEGDFWYELIGQLVSQGAIATLTRELALQSQLIARDEGQWMIRVERESLNQQAARERLQNALIAAGHEIKLVVEVGSVSDSPSRRNAAAAAALQEEAQQIILSDPFVQEMMRDHGAKIVTGSIKPV